MAALQTFNTVRCSNISYLLKREFKTLVIFFPTKPISGARRSPSFAGRKRFSSKVFSENVEETNSSTKEFQKSSEDPQNAMPTNEMMELNSTSENCDTEENPSYHEPINSEILLGHPNDVDNLKKFSHPWPELSEFVEIIQMKSYSEAASGTEIGNLKQQMVAFGRNRDDVFE